MADREISRRDFVRDGALAAAGIAAGVGAAQAAKVDTSKIINYNTDMDYRALGKTGLMVSVVCMGGHWKRIDKMVPGVFKGGGWLSADLESEGFRKNRHDVVSRCMEVGINYIDACTYQEVMAYSQALKGRRGQMHLGFSWYQEEMRNGNFRTTEKLLQTLDKGMKKAGLEYIDLWRITMHEQSGKHTKDEVAEMMGALAEAKKQGKARFTGFSSHDRKHIKWMCETYPDVVDVAVTPFTAKSKVHPKDSLYEAANQHNIGVFGIKPFASNSLFKGDSTLTHRFAEEDDRRARLTLRYILSGETVTAPIPGLINTHQVDNVARAVKERRELDVAEKAELEKIADDMWASLPREYEWLKEWEYV